MIKYLVPVILALLFSWSPASAQNQVKFSKLKPGMRDEFIEREAVRLANKRAMLYAWHEEFRQAKIISDNWEDIIDCDGNLVGREIHIELYATLFSGKCAMADFTFREKLIEDGRYSHIALKS